MRCKVSEKSMVKHYMKKGLWSPDEDQKLTNYVMNHGHLCWSSVPVNAGLQRNGKSCRLRWINYLRPGLKRGAFSLQEEETILTLHALLGNKWSQISQHLPGRTDNEIKNYWHSHLKKRSVAKSSQHLHDQVLHPKLDDYTNSNMPSMESSSSCPNNTTSCFTNGSSAADMAKQVPPVSQISNLPKIIFADWISREQFQQDFGMSSDQPLIIPGSNNHQLTNTDHEYWQQHNAGSAEIENHKWLDTSGSNIETTCHMTQMTIDQIFEFNDGDFGIDDLMYI